MSQSVVILSTQVVIMFIVMLIGVALFKLKQIDRAGAAQMSNLVLYVANPALVLASFCVPFDMGKLISAGVVAVFTFAMFWIYLLVARLFFRKDGICQFSVIFSNTGFLGIPLVQATLGSEAVFFVSIIMAVLVTAQWVYGVTLIAGTRDVVSVKRLLTNPAIITVPVGLVLFCCNITLPQIPLDVLDILGNLNTGLAMLVVGTYLATTDLVAALKRRKTWMVMLVRLVILPAITAAVAILMPGMGELERTVCIITLATPVGAAAAMYSQMFGKDPTEATGYVALSTLGSLVTMPAVLAVSSLFL